MDMAEEGNDNLTGQRLYNKRIDNILDSYQSKYDLSQFLVTDKYDQ